MKNNYSEFVIKDILHLINESKTKCGFIKNDFSSAEYKLPGSEETRVYSEKKTVK